MIPDEAISRLRLRSSANVKNAAYGIRMRRMEYGCAVWNTDRRPFIRMHGLLAMTIYMNQVYRPL